MSTPLSCGPAIAYQLTSSQPSIAGWLVLILFMLTAAPMSDPGPFEVVAIALIVIWTAEGSRIPRDMSRIAVAGAMFAYFAAIPTLLWLLRHPTTDPHRPVEHALTSIYFVVLFLVVATYLSFSNASRMQAAWRVYAYSHAAVIVVTVPFYALASGPLAGLVTEAERLSAFHEDPNVLGASLVPALVVAWQSFLRESGAAALRWIPLAAVLGTGLLLSFSRGAWLNAAVALLVVTIAGAGKGFVRPSRLVISTGVLLLATVGAMALALHHSPEVATMLEVRANVVQHYDVGPSGRLESQVQSLRLVREYPLGVGADGVTESLGTSTHNTWLKWTAEHGWLAALYLAIVTVVVYRWARSTISRVPQSADGFGSVALIVSSSLAGIAAESLVIDQLHWRHLWLLVASLVALTRLMKHELGGSGVESS